MVKLIVSDIDGTLLPYGQINLRPSLFQVIEQLRERGVIFWSRLWAAVPLPARSVPARCRMSWLSV